MAKLDMQVEPKIIFQSETVPRALHDRHGFWKILSALDGADSSIAEDELKNGCNGFVLTNLESVQALRGLPLHTFCIYNNAGDEGAQALAELVATQSIDPARLDICFGAADDRFSLIGFVGPFINLRYAHDDLGEIIRSAKQWKSHSTLSVSLTAQPHMFNTLAKFRAMRILWEQELPQVKIQLHAEVAAPLGETSEHYMLRCVSAAMGAGLGGADSISILPHKTNGVFERRLVRNIQNILLHESHLADVADAAAGSEYVEKLTRKLVEDAKCE
jgi:hypothetical protein